MRTALSEAECLAILGVTASATMEEIREAFQYLREANHPDKFQSERKKAHAAERFKQVTRAYEDLVEIRKGKTAKPRTTPASPPEKGLPGPPARWRWSDPWRRWNKAGPPPRCSPDTAGLWPLLPSVHQWWLRPCAADEEQEANPQPPTAAPLESKLYIEDADPLTTAVTLFTQRARHKGLAGDLYWSAETEQNAKVCHLRFLKPVIGDVCAQVEATLAKQMNLTYIELKAGTVLWWRPDEALRRLRLRGVAVLVWLAFSALAQIAHGTGAIGLAAAGLFVLAWIAHWDFHVDYGRVDWKCLYPVALWWSRFEIPLLIHVVGFFAWRYWGGLHGTDPGAHAIYLPVLLWLIARCLWRCAWPVDFPEQNLGERPEPKDVDAYLAAINTMFSGKR